MTHKVAYIMSRFPHLPETFILREMEALENLGWEISLYPLILQKQQVVHTEARKWISRAHNLPFISVQIIKENFSRFFKSPRKYLELLFRSIWENRTSLKFLSRAVILFPKAVYAARLMDDEGIEHIHAHYATHPAFVAWIIYNLSGIGYTITVHAHDIFVERTMLKTKINDAINVRAISMFNRNFLSNLYGHSLNHKIQVIHCGIDPANFKLRVNGFNPSDEFNVLSIGSLEPYKGFPYLIEACAILRDRGVPVHCNIIGGGKERTDLEMLIKKHELRNVVNLLGPLPQDEVAQILPSADCYVQPSIITSEGKMEGIPVALMEALACGLPTVTTSISGIPEIVIPDNTGYLVPPANATKLADALEQVYSNYSYAKALGKAGRELVLKEYNLKSNTVHLTDLFEKALAMDKLKIDR